MIKNNITWIYLEQGKSFQCQQTKSNKIREECEDEVTQTLSSHFTHDDDDVISDTQLDKTNTRAIEHIQYVCECDAQPVDHIYKFSNKYLDVSQVSISRSVLQDTGSEMKRWGSGWFDGVLYPHQVNSVGRESSLNVNGFLFFIWDPVAWSKSLIGGVTVYVDRSQSFTETSGTPAHSGIVHRWLLL